MEGMYSMNHFHRGVHPGVSATVINCFTDGFDSINYVNTFNEKVINLKSNILCDDLDVFKKSRKYSQCISFLSKNVFPKEDCEKFIFELSMKNIINQLDKSPCIVYNYNLKSKKDIVHYSIRIFFSSDDGIIIGFKSCDSQPRF